MLEQTLTPRNWLVGYVESATSKVICSVFGPKQNKNDFSEKGKLWCDFKYAPFAEKLRRKTKGQVRRETFFS